MTQLATAMDRRAALAGYRTVSLEARVAAADPHTLVAMLFERLTAQLRAAHAAAQDHDNSARLRATERALAIVDNLDATLDQKRGGAAARHLHDLYLLLREKLLAGDAAGLGQAVDSAVNITAAWRQIAPQVR
ncbi:MAG: flagellar protein FliS [Sphingomonadaceae bacterium]